MGKNTRKWKKFRMLSKERKKAAIAARLAEKAGAAPPPPSEEVEAEVEANEGPLKKRVVLMEEDKTKGEEVEVEDEEKEMVMIGGKRKRGVDPSVSLINPLALRSVEPCPIVPRLASSPGKGGTLKGVE